MKNRGKYVVSLGLALPVVAGAVGLGNLHIQSSLNQPFKAYVNVNLPGNVSLSAVKVRLAGVDAFKHAGLDRPYILSKLVFRLKQRQGNTIVEITSQDRIDTPFLNILLDVAWADGQFYRAYTVLLDPPGYEMAVKKTSPIKIAVKKSAVYQPAPPPKRDPSSSELTSTKLNNVKLAVYGPTHRKDDLWKIAMRYKPQNATIDQVMLAILKENPNAFVGNNVNGLMNGVRLRIPNQAMMLVTSRVTAKEIIVKQSKLWQQGGKQQMAQSSASSDVTASSVTTSQTNTSVMHPKSKQIPHSYIPSVLSSIAVSPAKPMMTSVQTSPSLVHSTVLVSDLPKQTTETSPSEQLFDDFMPVPKVLSRFVKEPEPQAIATASLTSRSNVPSLSMNQPKPVDLTALSTTEQSLLLLKQQVQRLEQQNQQLHQQLKQTTLQYQQLTKEIAVITNRLATRQPVATKDDISNASSLADANGLMTYVIAGLLCLLAGAGTAILAMRYLRLRRGTPESLSVESMSASEKEVKVAPLNTDKQSNHVIDLEVPASAEPLEAASQSQQASEEENSIANSSATRPSKKRQVSVSTEAEAQAEVDAPIDDILSSENKDKLLSPSLDPDLSEDVSEAIEPTSATSKSGSIKQSPKDVESDETVMKSTALLQSALHIPVDIGADIESLSEEQTKDDPVASIPAKSDEPVQIDESKVVTEADSLAFDLSDVDLPTASAQYSDQASSNETARTDDDAYVLDFEPTISTPTDEVTVSDPQAQVSSEQDESTSGEDISAITLTITPQTEDKDTNNVGSAVVDEALSVRDADGEGAKPGSAENDVSEETNFTSGINMATQLALAETYIAMEDWESAKASLNEVMQGGTDGQRQKASALLANIKDK